MRIGFDAKRLFNNFTGLGNYSRFVVQALSDHFPEDEYLLYTPTVRSHPETEAILTKPNIRLRRPAYLNSILLLGSIWRSYSLGAISARDGVKVFHGLSNELPLTKPVKLKTVVTVHDLIFKRYPAFYNPLDVRMYSWKMKLACKSANCIIATSNQTADDLVEYFRVERTRIKVVYQGIHPIFKREYSQPELEEVKARYKLPDHYILQVGTIESRKNALLLLQSLLYLPAELSAVIVGRSTSYVKELHAFIAANRLENRVLFIHQAGFTDLPMIYRLARVFVYPSIFEGFGIPVVEAIASGVPVIASRGTCLEEAGGPDASYVNPRDAEELGHAIQSILSDDQKSQAMCEKSRGHIQRFEPQVIAGDLMKVYREIIS